MKKLPFLLTLLIIMAGSALATPTVNITPLPKSMTVHEGSYPLPQVVTIDVSAVADSLADEAPAERR